MYHLEYTLRFVLFKKLHLIAIFFSNFNAESGVCSTRYERGQMIIILGVKNILRGGVEMRSSISSPFFSNKYEVLIAGTQVKFIFFALFGD